MWEQYWTDRGSPWECDPGPAPGSAFAHHFAQTPGYRAIGLAWSGQEAYRWHFGPMFYRGRLDHGSAHVLVVGQEGAQDESLSHRSFTGGTGGRLQYLLTHLGITSSYLFLNTFVYPIFGQYDDALRPLAQDPRSPIAAHRNALFDLVVAQHPLRLVIAVGTAAKESVASWIHSHGGQAAPDALESADAQVIAPGLHAVGVLHPGGAGKGGSVSAIVASFRHAAELVAGWSAHDAGWLPVDAGAQRQPPAAYRYRSAPVPFADLPFGSPWRLGFGSTASNRRDGQTAIQLYSADGAYNNTGTTLSYPAPGTQSRDGYADQPGDLAYEPPRGQPDQHDPGPPADLAILLQGGAPGLPWPDFHALGLPAHPSLGYGPIYRGRLTAPSVLVLADQAGADDVFSGRALTGDAGQHLQAFLRAAGLTSRYAILRTLPVNAAGAPANVVTAAAQHPAVLAVLREAVRRCAPAVVVAVGPQAATTMAAVTAAGTPSLTMPAFGSTGWLAAWQQALQALAHLAYPVDVPRSAWDGGRGQIARADLPYGTLRWQGTSGDLARYATISGAASADYLKLTMPSWAAALAPASLTAAERAALTAMRP